VKKWLDGDANDASGAAPYPAYLDSLQPGRYVRIVGAVKMYNNKRSILAHAIHPVTSPDQITHHILSTIYAHLNLTRGPVQSFGNAAAPGNYGASNNQGLFTGNFTRVQYELLKVIKSAGVNASVHINDIKGRLRALGSDREVDEATNFLLNEGHIMQGMDEECYSLAGAFDYIV
jgi:replication factor A2